MSEEAKPAKPPVVPVKRDVAWHIQWGLFTVGIFGAVLSCTAIKWVQSAVDADHPLNGKYKDAYLWVPGAFLIAGPLLGLAYFALFADTDEVENG